MHWVGQVFGQVSVQVSVQVFNKILHKIVHDKASVWRATFFFHPH